MHEDKYNVYVELILTEKFSFDKKNKNQIVVR